jgi:leucyl/phenylalanyl-tRNA--protein transferase
MPADLNDEVVAVGGDLTLSSLETAYTHGLFPMRLGGLTGPLGWWSPNPRGVLPLTGLRVSRSLRRSVHRYDVSVDSAFTDVIEACARRSDPTNGWIGPDFREAYTVAHRHGIAHSIEVWSGPDLVGGLYGVGYGGLFAGESMFSRARDASKVALVALVHLLAADADERRLLDVQWVTPHLGSLGAVALSRSEYLRRLQVALTAPEPDWVVPHTYPGPIRTR